MALTIKPSIIDGSKSPVSWTDPQVLDNLGSIEISQLSEGVRSAASSFLVIDALANRLTKIWKLGESCYIYQSSTILNT